jgi:hypothetical protein
VLPEGELPSILPFGSYTLIDERGDHNVKVFSQLGHASHEFFLLDHHMKVFLRLVLGCGPCADFILTGMRNSGDESGCRGSTCPLSPGHSVQATQ